MSHATDLARMAVQVLLLSTVASAYKGSSLLSHRQRLFMDTTPVLEDGKQVCAELVNKGSYFSVEVEVGTPGQKFGVVADTGSNTLIVPSCICQQAGYCTTADRCFVGTNRSSTFELVREADQPVSLVLSFGSGMIRGVLARERVAVGGLRARMEKGIVLMTGKALDFGGSFEGILGLGIPKRERKLPGTGQRRGAGVVKEQDMGKIVDWLKRIMQKHGAGASGEKAAEIQAIQALAASSELHWEDGQPIPGMAGMHQVSSPPGFLEQAGISRFGICFNEGRSGVLRLGTPSDAAVPRHSSVGQEHWGLGLSGISLAGSKTVHLDVCSGKDLPPGQDTPCGAIPDSGTTMITGPAEGVRLLLDSVCDQWERCRQNHTALQKAAVVAGEAARQRYGVNPFDLEPWPKYKVLELLMLDCASWLTESDGLGELPALQFHVTGGQGTRQTLELPGHYYVMERSVKDLKPSGASAQKGAAAPAEGALLNSTAGRSKVCIPAFSVLDYNTKQNGAVWILGSPFFYAFNVGYDLATKPPSLSLSPTKTSPCGGCDTSVGLVTEDTEVHHDNTASALLRRPLRVDGELRQPDYDVSLPL